MLSGRRGDKPTAARSFSLKTTKKQILRFAQDDTAGGFFRSLLVVSDWWLATNN
jgi:hypothetical protein